MWCRLAQHQHSELARSVVASLLLMNTAVAVPIHFHTIATDVDVRLDAYICHIDNVAHGLVIDCVAASEHNTNRIRSATRL